MSELQAFLTPEYMAIAVIAVLIIVAIFFAIVANKIIGVDSKMADLTDNIHNKVEKDITVLSQRLHDDIEERDAKHKAVLDNLGESWRGSLEKAVSDFRGEIGKFKGETAYSAEQLRDSMLKIISDNAVDFSEQIASVRDVNAKAIEDYQQNLTTQIRENAAREHGEMKQALEAIAAAVDSNVTDLVASQKKSIEKVTKSMSSGYQKLAEKVEQDINASTGSASETLANVTKSISSGVEDASGSLNESLAGINKELDDNLARINSRVNEALGAVATDMAGNFGTISERLNSDIKSVTDKLDGGISDVSTRLGGSVDELSAKLSSSVGEVSSALNASVGEVSGKLSENIDSVNSKIDSGIASVNKKVADDLSAIGGEMGQGIDTLGKQIDANFDKVGTKVNKRIQKDMRDMHETFRSFAAKVDAIEQTREHIAQLAENVSVLAQVLDDRRSRGSLGEVLIESIVKDTLSPSDYELNAELSNGFKVDCLLKLPKPSGSIAISTKIDLSDLEVVLAPTAAAGEVKQAREAFGAKLAATIDDLAANAVIKDETAEGALLLLPSESAFSEAHVNHRALVDEAYKKQVWLASPSTLIAMVTVARAVIKDATARREIESLRAELTDVEADYDRLERNIERLMRTSDDLLSLSTDTRKGARRISDRFGQLHSIIGASHVTARLAEAEADGADDAAAADDDKQKN